MLRWKRMLVIGVFLWVCISVYVPFTTSVRGEGNTIYVDDDNTSGPWNGTQEYPYQWIQDAITAADNGDIISVQGGTYYETITIEKNIVLVGQGSATTIIDGGGSGHVIYAHGSSSSYIEVCISGFTVQNAGGVGYDCIAYSYVQNGEIENNIITQSDESDGVQLDHCTEITINGNTISNNDGAGIRLTLSENNQITDNTITNNQQGIYIYYLSNENQVSDNAISGNTQYGVYVVQAEDNQFYRNDFTNNGQNAKAGENNEWSHLSQGNYWDDYGGYDENPQDGIGDVPYSIEGGGQDDYPLGYFQQSDPEPEGNQQPIAYNPTIAPTTTEEGELVSFSGSGSDNDGYIIAYNWRSNLDGQLNSDQTFSTTTLSVGTHTIYFKVKDNDNDWSSEVTATVCISPENSIPVASIEMISPNPAEEGAPVVFSGAGTDEDGDIIAYKWTSSIDGVIGSDNSFTTSSLSAGTHTITLQVQDNAEAWSNQVSEVLVIEADQANPENQPPVAHAGGKYLGSTNEALLFDGSQSIDTDGTIVTYLWDFDDGTTSTEQSPSHVFEEPGNYSVVLTVTDDYGESATDTNRLAKPTR